MKYKGRIIDEKPKFNNKPEILQKLQPPSFIHYSRARAFEKIIESAYAH